MGQCQCDSKPSHPLYRRRLQGDEIRVLNIHSQSDFSLEIAPLSNKPQYSAVSYCWGEDINDICNVRINGLNFPLRKHVSTMLERLHRRHQVFRVWIDRVCIDQNDTHDKSEQVLSMGKIYSQATRVYAWLGEANPEMDCIFDVLTTFRDRKREVKLPVHFDAAEQLSYYRGLFREIYSGRAGHVPRKKRTDDPRLHDEFNWLRPFYFQPYWRRVWIVQELVLAEQVIVCCGDKCIDFGDIYGLSLDWGSFEQGFDSVEYDEALVAKWAETAKAESSLDLVQTTEKFNIGWYISRISTRLLEVIYGKQVQKKQESNSSRWKTIQTIRGHRRRREMSLEDAEIYETSPRELDRGVERCGKGVFTKSERGNIGHFDEVLRVYAQHICKCPKDKVYAFRELVQIWKDDLVPNYSKSDLEVFLDATRLGVLDPCKHGGRNVTFLLWSAMGLGGREEFNTCLSENFLEG
jgi:hypothetical protein